MPARQIFGNKRRRRGTRNRYTYVPVYVSENDSGIEDENRRAHAGWKSHAEKNIIEAFEAIFRADARKPISSALFVSPPPRFIKPRGEGFGNTPDINATAVWIQLCPRSLFLFVFLSDKLFQGIKNISSSLFLVYSKRIRMEKSHLFVILFFRDYWKWEVEM